MVCFPCLPIGNESAVPEVGTSVLDTGKVGIELTRLRGVRGVSAADLQARWPPCGAAPTVLVLSKETINEELGSGGWAGALVRAPARRFHDLEAKVWQSRTSLSEGLE